MFSFFIIKRMSAALSAKRYVARHFLRSNGIISSSLSSLSSNSLSRFSTSGSFPSSTSSSSSSESSSSSSSPEEDDTNNNNNNNNNNNKDDDDDKEKNVTDKTLLSSFFALVHKKHPKDVPNDTEKLQKHFPSLGMTEFQSKMNGQFGKKIGMSVKERKRIAQYLNKFKNGLLKI
jgi:hypothetical protein